MGKIEREVVGDAFTRISDELSTERVHIPVLLSETCDLLITDPGGVYFDATVGFGGHTSEIAKRLNPNGIVIGTDVDATAFEHTKALFAHDQRCRFYRFNFSKIDLIAKLENISSFNGILADLGVSSYQLDSAEAGISFAKNAELDLRLDKSLPLTAKDLLNTFDEETISNILFEFGEERNARRLSRMIVEARAITYLRNSNDIEHIVREITPAPFVVKTMRRVFQALRIYINDELGNLRSLLTSAVHLLAPKGRLVVITFHSIEDRVVKHFLKKQAAVCICPPGLPVCICGKTATLKLLTSGGIKASGEELANNRRARSAKLRAAEKI